jgi:hypothetical protein
VTNRLRAESFTLRGCVHPHGNFRAIISQIDASGQHKAFGPYPVEARQF